MKLWQKGTAAILLLSMILLQTVAFASDKAADLERRIDRLVAFGILSETEVVNQSPITRGEMADLAVKASNNVAGVGKGETYVDVPADHPYCASIETANTLGIVGVNDEAIFNPDAQVTLIDALVMVVNAMGYSDIALSSGGYPTGYLSVSSSQKLLKGVTNQYLTKEDAVRLVSNMMDADSIEHVYYENNPAYATDGNVTYIEDTFEVKKYKADVQEVNTTNKTVVAKIIEGYYIGQTFTFRLSEFIPIESIGGRITLYLDRYDFNYAVYLEPRDGSAGVISDTSKDSGVIYDIIAETNKNEVGVALTLRDWKYVAFTNLDKTYRISDQVIATYNDEPLAGQAYDYVGAFCKAVLQDGYIVRMDIYPLTEGGIIYRADANELRFSQGESYENYMMGFANAPDLQIYIDGQAGKKMQDLKSNMVFDYWYVDGGTKFIIVASSRVAKGALTNVDSEYMTIGGVEYLISETYGWYSFSADELSFIPGDIHDLYGMEVTAYIDDNQRVRYVVPEIGKDESLTFKGFVMRAYGEPESDERYIKVFRIDGQGEVKYKVREKLRTSINGRISVDYDYIYNNYKANQARCDATNLFFDFTLDKNGEICLIEKVEYFGKNSPQTYAFSNEYHQIGNVYADEAYIFAIMNIDGKFTVKQVSYANDLKWTTPTGGSVEVYSDFNLEKNPIADYIVLGTGSDQIRDAQNQLEIIESIKWTGEDDIWMITLLNGETYNVPKSFIDTHHLKKNVMIQYGRMGLGATKLTVNDAKTRDLSDHCNAWPTNNSTYSQTKDTGFYKADSIIERNKDIIQFKVNGITSPVYLYIDDATAGYYKMKIYEYLGKGKIQKARDSEAVGTNIAWYIRPVLKYPVMNIQKGDDVWFSLTESWGPKIEYMIYQNNHNFFN